MGSSNSSNDKLTIDQKLQFLQTKVNKFCSYHSKQSNYYCANPNCQKCPFLCQDCVRQNIHQHQEGIYNFNEFLKAIIGLIQAKKLQQNQIMQASMSYLNQDYSTIYKEQIKLMDQFDALHKQIVTLLSEFRQRLQINLDRLTKKVNKTFQVKTSSFINFYRNPNILACKIASEPNERFLLQLKGQLRSLKKRNTMINQQQQFNQLKIQFGNVKSKIRDLLNVTNPSGFTKKASLSNAYSIVPALKKTFILSSDCPTKIYSAGSNVNISTNKELFSVEGLSKQIRKILSQPVSLLTNKKQGDEFIGMLNQSKVIVYDGKNINQLTLITKISSVNILKFRRKIYGLLGQQQGILNVVDLDQNKSAFHYRCGDQAIACIEICQTNSTICCAGRRTPIYLFKYKSKFSNMIQDKDMTQLQFQFILQINLAFIPQGELQLMRINSTELYLFGPCRNIVIFDLMLNTEIIRTEYSKISSNFIEAQFITINEIDYLVTLNANEDVVNFWQIDKIKRTIKLQQLMKEKAEKAISSMLCARNQLWIARENQKNIDIFTLNFQ